MSSRQEFDIDWMINFQPDIDLENKLGGDNMTRSASYDSAYFSQSDHSLLESEGYGYDSYQHYPLASGSTAMSQIWPPSWGQVGYSNNMVPTEPVYPMAQSPG